MEIDFPFWVNQEKVNLRRIDEVIRLIGEKNYREVSKLFDDPQLASGTLWMTILRRDIAAVKQVFEFFFPKTHRWYHYGAMIAKSAHNCSRFPDDPVWLEVLTLLVNKCPPNESIRADAQSLSALAKANPAAYQQLVSLKSIKLAIRQNAKKMFSQAISTSDIATARILLPEILDAELMRLLFKNPNTLLLFTDDAFVERIKKAATNELAKRVAQELG